jgi:hypothetical protein
MRMVEENGVIRELSFRNGWRAANASTPSIRAEALTHLLRLPRRKQVADAAAESRQHVFARQFVVLTQQ